MPSTGRKLELKAKTSVAQTASQVAVYAKGSNPVRADVSTALREISACFAVSVSTGRRI
jgi:hypothetical protein